MKLIIISKFQARITAAVQTNVLFSETLIFFAPFSIDVIAWDDMYKKYFKYRKYLKYLVQVVRVQFNSHNSSKESPILISLVLFCS
jgi:hypothetical protein